MRNIILLGAIAAMTACGYSEDKFNDDFATEFCRVTELCGGECAEAGEGGEDAGECDFDSDAAKSCVDGLAAVTECDDTDPMALFDLIPATCADVCEIESSDSGM